MVGFLVSPRSNPNPNGTKAGDIIDVRPDGWNWSAAELPKVVNRPDISMKDAARFVQFDQEVFLRPVRDRAGNYYDIDLNVIPSLDETKIDVRDGMTKVGGLSDGRVRIQTREQDISDKRSLFLDTGVEVESKEEWVVHNKFRFQIVAGVIVDKVL